MRDRESTNIEAAAYLARMEEDFGPERPDPSEYMDRDEYDLDCTNCGGNGDCVDGSDPLGDCPYDPHPCHACGGSGRREDQVIF